MKKIMSIIGILMFSIFLSSCSDGMKNSEINKSLENKEVERITITNARYAGRYTIIDNRSKERFVSHLKKAKIASKDSHLEPDFIFDVYSGDTSLGSFKYVAGLTNSEEANLIDSKGKLYRVSRNIENIFMKRLMKKNDLKNVPEYYTSLINIIIDKTQVAEGSIVVADIGKDYAVTKSITSVEQESILNSINAKNAKVKFPSQGIKFDYSIEIKTGRYSNTSSETVVTVKSKDPSKKPVKYEVLGNYKKGNWEFHVKFK